MKFIKTLWIVLGMLQFIDFSQCSKLVRNGSHGQKKLRALKKLNHDNKFQEKLEIIPPSQKLCQEKLEKVDESQFIKPEPFHRCEPQIKVCYEKLLDAEGSGSSAKEMVLVRCLESHPCEPFKKRLCIRRDLLPLGLKTRCKRWKY
ncbi:unnamed protein product [Allacma fusca]|uniref:Uncharacterized protein n=1 Tax=Allacma fusca TaxID=39272 RepID=A0A8J2PV73_9HEXA|nr:unnamed protein product [Allacma fusca]